MTKSIAILLIGDELLDGRIADQNGLALSQRARRGGSTIVEVRIVPDDLNKIQSALKDLSIADLVVVSGGLGPTADDITRDAAARLVGDPLIENTKLLNELRDRFATRGYRFTPNNRRQCTFPSSATILPTEVGTAAGFSLLYHETPYYFFPGVPHEFRWFLERYVPFGDQTTLPRRRMIFFGLGESEIETRIRHATARAKDLAITVGYRAENALIEVILKGPTEGLAEVHPLILETIGPWLVSEDDESFPERLARRLRDENATVTVAESCTSGLLGARLTDVPGSSQYFHEGYLTYSNEAKHRLLGVPMELLHTVGAVSKEVVVAMARGARQKSQATYALAISGIAGPTGGTDQKPVGTVDFALATPSETFYRRAHFPGRSRQEVRALSVHFSAALLLWHLEARLEKHGVDALPA